MNFLGPKLYELSLVKNYVAHWGLAEAVRELLQNALDSASPFVYEFITQEGVDTVSLRLNSEFAILTPQTLLLGATSKAENKDCIGSFGEGYKIALLVLTRMGYDVDMLNGNKLWKPRFKFNAKFGEELLVVEETQLTDKTNKGLTFFVHGLTEEDVQSIVSSCIRMQSHIGAIKQTVYGDILLEQPGALYVGGLFICKTGMHFGYNIKPEHIKLERDRQTVSNWDLKTITKEMWFATKEYDKVAELIETETPDLDYAEYGCPELVKEACYQLFRKKHPGKVIARNNEQMQQLVAKGLTVYVGGGSYFSTVSESRSYRTENKNVCIVATPQQILKSWLSANRGEMRAKSIESFRKELIEVSNKWKAT